jgi:predicted nucleic acid-binding protein
VIYIDSSIALARLFFEARSPPERLWREHLVSSKLLAYEIWNRVHAYGLTTSHSESARDLLALVDMIEMTDSALARVLSPFPISVRTLDALHLATAEYLQRADKSLELASYDNRLIAAAHAIRIPIAAL